MKRIHTKTMSDAVSRADTQHQLNSVLDPIGARLPVEISSEIFILCLPDSGDRHPNSTTAPLLLLRICSVWANIARSTPVLWDTLRVEFPRAKGFEHLFDSYLARAQRRGLALTLDNCDGDCLEMLCAHVHRMQQPGSALLATSVNLKALRFSQPCFLYLCEVLSMLRATPGLIECTLIDACHDDPYEDSLTLPCLQSLSLGEDEHVCDVYILKYLSLPTLHTLSISYTRTDKNEAILTSFLTRLEAPLRSLRVDV
ncbi:hypothetical protein C8J57DRAFT_1732254 [Mycena rebaudengoi]|nr:hypothetical protein C8J57DRAFT_1732254 [Mycena rebaudengoi]